MTMLFIPKDANSSGIDITYTGRKRLLDIGGWYDGNVGLQGRQLSLTEFCRELGITAADLRATIKVLVESSVGGK